LLAAATDAIEKVGEPLAGLTPRRDHGCVDDAIGAGRVVVERQRIERGLSPLQERLTHTAGRRVPGGVRTGRKLGQGYGTDPRAEIGYIASDLGCQFGSIDLAQIGYRGCVEDEVVYDAH
jgi:hypothetical protein